MDDGHVTGTNDDHERQRGGPETGEMKEGEKEKKKMEKNRKEDVDGGRSRRD